MHLVHHDSITIISGAKNAYRFRIPKTYHELLDMRNILAERWNAELLSEQKPVSYVRAYDEELENAYFESLLQQNAPIHLENVSSKKILDHVRSLYLELGYFVPKLNAFVIPKVAPITLGINVKTLAYSTKEIYLLGKSLFAIVPPPRSPAHQKSYLAAANSGLISRIRFESGDEKILSELLVSGKINPVRLAKMLSEGYEKIGASSDWDFVDIVT